MGTRFQDIVNRDGVRVIWEPNKDNSYTGDWRDQFEAIANRARETTWGFDRELSITMWLVQRLEAAELKLEAAEGLQNKVKGQQLEIGRLRKRLKLAKEELDKCMKAAG